MRQKTCLTSTEAGVRSSLAPVFAYLFKFKRVDLFKFKRVDLFKFKRVDPLHEKHIRYKFIETLLKTLFQAAKYLSLYY